MLSSCFQSSKFGMRRTTSCTDSSTMAGSLGYLLVISFECNVRLHSRAVARNTSSHRAIPFSSSPFRKTTGNFNIAATLVAHFGQSSREMNLRMSFRVRSSRASVKLSGPLLFDISATLPQVTAFKPILGRWSAEDCTSKDCQLTARTN